MRLRMQLEPHPSQSSSLLRFPASGQCRAAATGRIKALANTSRKQPFGPFPREVSPKTWPERKLNIGDIDGLARARYSQAQIKDLVAHANPRSLDAAQSFGSFLRRDSSNVLQPTALPLSSHPSALCKSTTNPPAKDAPGGSARGSARSFSCFQRRTGGLRPL
jgi:hypothetical protein